LILLGYVIGHDRVAVGITPKAMLFCTRYENYG
jgi:hypothetical protein